MQISKKLLLKQLKEYSDEQIADAVSSGVVSIYELSHYAAGAFTPLRRKRVEAILSRSRTNSNDTGEEEIQEQEESSTTVYKEANDDNDGIDDSEDSIPVRALPKMIEKITSDDDGAEDPAPIRIPPRMFRAPFSFKGRIRRKEYCLSLALLFIINFLLSMVSMGMDSNNENIAIICTVIYLFLFIPTLWFQLAQGAKRCHDMSNSGWWQIIPFYWLMLMFGQGDEGSNKYGDSPK